MLNRILWWPYQAYCALTFALFVTIGFFYTAPLYLLFEEKAHAWIFSYYRLWAKSWFFLSGIRYRVEGKENLPDEPVIIVANHSSHIDLLNGAGACPLKTKPLAKSSLKKIPLLGFLFSTVSVFVDRSSKESREKSVQDLMAALNRGFSLFMFPEGTRNRTDQPLAPFYDGAFRLSIRSGKPIHPLVILHARFLMPVKGISLRPGTIVARYLPPVYPTGLTEDDIPALKEKVRAQMDAVIRKAEIRPFPEPEH